MSMQVSILIILAGQPDGHASVDTIKQYLAIFHTSGDDWTQRIKRLAARAPNLDVFSQKLVLREPGSWRLTDEGRAFLATLEQGKSVPEHTEPSVIGDEPTSPVPGPLRLVERRHRGRKKKLRREKRTA